MLTLGRDVALWRMQGDPGQFMRLAGLDPLLRELELAAMTMGASPTPTDLPFLLAVPVDR